jgi:hypothetical protein
VILANQARLQDNKVIKTLSKIIRKIAHTSATCTGYVVDQWKEWTNWFFHTAANTITNGQVFIAKTNLFRPMNKIYGDLLHNPTWEQAKIIAHLISTRQMPYCGQRTERKSMETHRNSMQSKFKATNYHLIRLYQAARRIGAICKSIRPLHKLPPGIDKVSVNSSGEFTQTIRLGGQAKAVALIIQKHLIQRHMDTFTESTPFGDI